MLPVYLSLAPVEYNIGKVLPLVENLFLGPSVMYSVDTDFDLDDVSPSFGAIISVPF